LNDQARLLAVDVETGGVAWQRESASSEAGLSLQADEGYLHMQPVLGRCHLLDAWNGMPKSDGPLTLIGRHRWARIEPTQVAQIDPATGKELWRLRLDRPTSLTGELPQLIARGDGLLLRVPRNQADDLLCIDPATGKTLWSRPVMGRSFDLEGAACDGPRLFLPVDQSLQALSIASGKPLWSADLPAGRWRAATTQDLVLVRPDQARLRMDPARSYRRLAALDATMVWPSRGPTGLGHLVSGVTTSVLASQSPSHFTVLAFDPVTGREVRRMVLDGQGRFGEAKVAEGLAVMATADRVWVFR
jgi:outer membrane protein assembly factor BamB